VAAWFEDEEFWKSYASLMFDERRWAETPAVVDGILRLAGLPLRLGRPGKGPRSRVLDTCCGVGRHSIEFASRGFAVTGIDITTAYLDAARESATGLRNAPDFERADVRTFLRPRSFGLAVNLFRSFGYFDTPEEDLAALRNIAASLAPGGAFVLETLGKELAARDFMEGEWFERDGCTVLTEYGVEGDWEGLRHRWILLREGERIDRAFVLRLYSAREIKEALLASGFASVEVFGSFDASPYDDRAETMVALARTPLAAGSVQRQVDFP
jgi:SAM-dependent methyltransferase